MRKILVLLSFITAFVLHASGQDGLLKVAGNFSTVGDELPISIIVQYVDMGNYEIKHDTYKSVGKKFKLEREIGEPKLVTITLNFKNRKQSSIAEWLLPGSYTFSISEDFKPILINSASSANFVAGFNKIEELVKAKKQEIDSLIKALNFKALGAKNYQNRAVVIRDSVDNVIDENIYKTMAMNNMDKPEGLYALSKYANSKQRKKWQPELISNLLNQFDNKIKQLPTAKILNEKLNLAITMLPGNQFEDITLADTAGKMISISDFKGKYLLVEFWASWCGPCRDENPHHISAKTKFKDVFEVAYITLDEEKGKKWWLEAIRKDNIGMMPQLSDFDKKAQDKFDIQVIPANFLLDKTGKIIAINLRGKELEIELEGIIKK